VTPEELGRRICEGRGVEALPAYLAAGGSVDAIEPRSGMPLLHLVCEHRSHDMIRALIEQGADIHLRDPAGQTPMHVAVDGDIDSVVQRNGGEDELRFDTTRLLLELGADPEVRDAKGRTPRDWAAGYGPVARERYDRLLSR
jgi:ankyrin repeat protein